MPTYRQLTVEVPTTEKSKGSSGTSTHQKAFPASPIHSGELTDATLREIFEREVLSAIVDGNHYGLSSEHNRDYAQAPDLNSVRTTEPGDPASPFAPNILSPTDGINPTSIPVEGADKAVADAKGKGDPFTVSETSADGNGMPSPSKSAANISRVTISSLGNFGSSNPK